MSFQINASYCEELHFEHTKSSELYALLLEAIQLLGWSRGASKIDQITAFPGFSLIPFGEVVNMQINYDKVVVTSSCIMPQIWSFGQNKRNIRKLGRALNHLIQNRTEDQLRQKYFIASSEFIADTQEKVQSDRFKELTSSTSKITGVFSIFNPKPGYYITPILINLNILYFILLGLAGAGFWNYNLHGFEYLGVNLLDLTLTQHEWWRLLTYQFMHGGILHLLGNMFSLLMIGAYLEPLLGKWRFLVFYLICGTIGGLFSIYIHPFLGSVGASAAIIGMYGVFLGLLSSDLIEKHTRNAILSTLIFFLTLQLLFGLQGPVDNSAHVGGLLTGFVLGLISISAIRKENTWNTVKRLSIIVLMAIFIIFFTLKEMPNKANEFRAVIQEFGLNDDRAQNYLRMLNESSDDAIVQEIKIQSLGFIKQNAEVLDRLDQMPIGKNGHYRVNLLRKYLLLQAKRASSEMFWIYYGRRTPNDKKQIEACDTELRRITYELSNTSWTFQ